MKDLFFLGVQRLKSRILNSFIIYSIFGLMMALAFLKQDISGSFFTFVCYFFLMLPVFLILPELHNDINIDLKNGFLEIFLSQKKSVITYALAKILTYSVCVTLPFSVFCFGMGFFGDGIEKASVLFICGIFLCTNFLFLGVQFSNTLKKEQTPFLSALFLILQIPIYLISLQSIHQNAFSINAVLMMVGALLILSSFSLGHIKSQEKHMF